MDQTFRPHIQLRKTSKLILLSLNELGMSLHRVFKHLLYESRDLSVTGCSGLLQRRIHSLCLQRELHMVEIGPFGTKAKHRLNRAKRDNQTKQLRYWSLYWMDFYCIIFLKNNVDCKNSFTLSIAYCDTLHKHHPFFPHGSLYIIVIKTN